MKYIEGRESSSTSNKTLIKNTYASGVHQEQEWIKVRPIGRLILARKRERERERRSGSGETRFFLVARGANANS